MAQLTKKDRTFKFTQQRIEELPPAPPKKRIDYYDSDTTKLICRVTDQGTKTFCVLKCIGSDAKRITLGRYPDISVSIARLEASKQLIAIAVGIHPPTAKEKRVAKDKAQLKLMTLKELLEQYLLDKKGLREATIIDYRKNMRAFNDWLDLPVRNITREMVLSKRNEFTGGRDNKMRVLRVLMIYAHKALTIIDANPVDILRDGKLWAKPTRRTSLIPSDQLKEWINAVLSLKNEQAKVYLLLLLHTGLRDSDVRYLEWRDVDFTHDSFLARDTKNHPLFTAYIAPQIKPYLRNLYTLTGTSTYLFPGNNKDGVMGVPDKPIDQVIKQTGIQFSSHDLKRTFLTLGEAAMIPFSLLQALANHVTDSNVTGGYIHPEAKTCKAATFKIADLIEFYTLNEEPNVIALRSNAK